MTPESLDDTKSCRETKAKAMWQEAGVGHSPLPRLCPQQSPSRGRILTGRWQQWPVWCRQRCWAVPGCGMRTGRVEGGSACSRTQLGRALAAGWLPAGLSWRPRTHRGSGCPGSAAAETETPVRVTDQPLGDAGLPQRLMSPMPLVKSNTTPVVPQDPCEVPQGPCQLPYRCWHSS